MRRIGDEIEETGVEAREGVDVKGMTTVLWVSLALVIVLLLAVWLFWQRHTAG